MGQRTRARIGTTEGVKTVRVYSANPKTADGYNTFIFRRDVARSLNKLAWAPVIDARQNRIPVGIELSDERVRYSREQKKALVLFLAEQLRNQYGPVDNDDFGRFGLQRLFVKEVQRHALATRREYVSTLSARSVASGMVHFAAAPNEEIVRRNGIRYFEYGLAKVRMDDGLYLIMGEVGVRSGSSPYYDQHVVAKFKADSEVSSLQGHIRIGESAFERVYDNRFRLILQGVAMYYDTHSSNPTISNQTIKQSPKFSIIIPVYNVAPYLRECLDSVCVAADRVGNREQGTGNRCGVEVICVDDGSTDGSSAILNEYARRQSNNQTIPNQTIFKAVHQPNAGVSAARNRGLEIATGEWVWFVDADDEIAEDSLKLLKGLVDDPLYDPLQWVSFRHDIIGESQAKPLKCDGVLYGKTADCQIAKTFFGAAWSRIFRRSTIGSLRFRAYHYNEDAVFVMDFSSRGRGWLDVDVPLYHYRLSGGSATRRRLSKEVVAKIFESENDLIDSAFRIGEKFPEADLSGLLQVLARRNFLTYERAYFKLNAAERDELLPVWLSLQDRFSGCCRFSARRRICLWLARHFRSGRVVKFLVIDLGRVNGVFRRLCRRSVS